MTKRTKFYLGLIPAVLLIIVAEATVPALIANFAVWMIGSDGIVGGITYFVFWVASFAAVLVTSILAAFEVYVHMVISNSPEVARTRPVAPIIPIRRGPN